MPVLMEKSGQVVIEKLILAGADYGQTIGDLAKAGRYDIPPHPDVLMPGRFPALSCHKPFSQEILLVCFGEVVDSDQGIEGLDNLILRSAELPELLMLGIKFPEAQKRSAIITLGPSWYKPGDTRYAPGLGMLGDKRTLNIYPCVNRKWPASCRFAAVSLV